MFWKIMWIIVIIGIIVHLEIIAIIVRIIWIIGLSIQIIAFGLFGLLLLDYSDYLH